MSPKRRSLVDELFVVVRSSTFDAPAASEVGEHAHDWHQLTCVAHGLMMVFTQAGAWLAPASCAVWVASGTRHSIRFVGASGLRVLYLRPGMRPGLPEGCCAVPLTGLLRELVDRTTQIGMLDPRDLTEAAMAELIVAELEPGGPPPLSLPEPDSPAMRQVARLMLSDAAGSRTTAGLSQAVGVGVRTLERRFQQETGMSPGRWRQRRQLLRGLELIAGGALVKSAASACGFASASAFVAAFRRTFGVTPQRFFAPDREALTLAQAGGSA